MKRYILPLVLMVSGGHALDVRYGQGDFEWSASVLGMGSSVTLDDRIISINEQHQNLGDSSWYYFGNIDIHDSKKLDTITDIADDISDTLPISPDDIAPFPTSYQISGIDVDLGIGYDLYHDDKGFFGIGLVTGISTPYMEMKNLIDSAEAINSLLDDTSTDVETYKLGVSLQSAFMLSNNFSIYGTAIWAYQTGSMENEIIQSSLDVTGTYTAFDVGIKYYFTDSSAEESSFYATIGYSYKNWTIDDISGSVGIFNLPNLFSIVDMEMTVDYVYAGIGYRF
ncbi:hypothetical protein MNB_SV-6-1243 [hydrothermal vent metagenome]|uniref:Uncharacterized protein n=1 Tax=hydrothermal vent metagenome TaxID=652676 RepID=A0A1W1BA26_9ZZZZ